MRVSGRDFWTLIAVEPDLTLNEIRLLLMQHKALPVGIIGLALLRWAPEGRLKSLRAAEQNPEDARAVPRGLAPL